MPNLRRGSWEALTYRYLVRSTDDNLDVYNWCLRLGREEGQSNETEYLICGVSANSVSKLN